MNRIDTLLLKSASIDMDAHKTIRNSMISKKGERTIDKEFVITGHRISKGSGTVLAYRVFNSGKPFIPDTAGFEKLTIYLPVDITEKIKTIDFCDGNNNAIAFWSNGSSNFPGHSGCFGYASSGTIHIKPVSNEEILADVDINFNLESPGGWTKDCGKFEFKKSLLFKEKDIHSLTPWEGNVGTHIYEESIR